MDLFDHAMQDDISTNAPLAARMRPRTLDELLGQDHIVGPGKLLRRAIEADRLFQSIILFGPPGTGKTTLAQIIANHTKAHYDMISAVLAGVAELRRVIAEAKERRKFHHQRTVLFIDEVHRWNKSQQDALLPYVENGLITLIGATTQNPFFEVIPALVSRSRIFELKPLTNPDLQRILTSAVEDVKRGLGDLNLVVSDNAAEHMIEYSGGDARNLLNAIELAAISTPPDSDGAIQITLEVAEESIQKRAIRYDKGGDAHYDTISAFIKSVRGSDPDAALFWLAKMLEAGEDPRFILRRLIILAGEDIGLADPIGLVIATAAAQAFEFIGLPEGIFPITEATLYLATAPKSNSAMAYFQAANYIKEHGTGDVPIHLMDSNRDARGFGHGKGYQYPHEYPGHFTPQQYVPDELIGKYFYSPSDQGHELEIQKRLNVWRASQMADLEARNRKNKEK